MVEFVEYSDVKIRIKLPKQLRQERSKRFFHGNLMRGKPESNLIVAIDIDLNAQRVEAYRKVFLGTADDRPATLPRGYKVQRSGPCGFGEDGLELFTSSEIFDKGYTLYSWQVLFHLQDRYVMMSVMGAGSREEFEDMAREIITSLTLLSPSESKRSATTATGSAIKGAKRGGLRAKEKARLAMALKSLPDELEYLRGPILAIADEDQDLLGSGEGDTRLLVEALEQQAASRPSGFAAAQAAELKEWLKGISTGNEEWARPIWFAIAFAMGYDMFGKGHN
jgi:hypothetical protein